MTLKIKMALKTHCIQGYMAGTALLYCHFIINQMLLFSLYAPLVCVILSPRNRFLMTFFS